MEETKEKKKIKKPVLFGAIGAVALIVIAVVVILVVRNKKDEYRIIKMYEVNGSTTVTREGKGDLDAYNNMVLQSGDDVYVKTGGATLKLDDDKFVYAEENTKFNLVATGTAKDSKTKINLKQGAITNEIQNKLSSNSTYEVTTQNSNMSVYGTIYRVVVYTDDNGIEYTKVCVFQGTVESTVVDKDGNMTDKKAEVSKGKEIAIYDDGRERDFVTGKAETIKYDELPNDVIDWLIEQIDNKKIELYITKEELQNIKAETEENNGPFKVTFVYNGKEFGSQTVEKGQTASRPSLLPAPTGDWDWDFNTAIDKDITIEWK